MLVQISFNWESLLSKIDKGTSSWGRVQDFSQMGRTLPSRHVLPEIRT
jgi:hypothetical protein